MAHAPVKKNTYAIVLCGGSGTRLWPLSRKDYPKQFLTLGGMGKSLLQLSVDRVKNIAPIENRWIVTVQGQEDICRAQTKSSASRILIEPESKNTAAAIAYAAWELMQSNPDSIMVCLPSDHSIQNTRSFEQSILEAIALAENDLFVTIGIKPNHPATGFGYIELGLPLDSQGQIVSKQDLQTHAVAGYSVRSFREKPNQAAAEQFLRTKKYLWNSGIFVWKTKTFWNAFSHLQPEIANLISLSTKENFSENYKKIENISIDIAFMEQTSHVACVPAHFDWNDVGSWAAVRECCDHDEHGNTVSGDVFLDQTKNSVIHSTGPFVSVIGLENIAVIASSDAIMVLPLSRSQEVKKIVQYLENNKKNLI